MPGFTGYSPLAVKTFFDGVSVSPKIDIQNRKPSRSW